MNIDTDHLLPSDEDERVKAFSIAQHRMLDVDMDVIRRSVLANISPASLLPWLAWDRSVDEYVDSWPTSVKRQVIAGSYSYHTIKGTPAALTRALAQLDYETTVTEWFQYGGDPYRFRVAFSLPENGTMTQVEFQSLYRLIMTAKNVRSMVDSFQVTVQVRAPAPHVAAWGHRRTRTVTLYPEPAA